MVLERCVEPLNQERFRQEPSKNIPQNWDFYFFLFSLFYIPVRHIKNCRETIFKFGTLRIWIFYLNVSTIFEIFFREAVL